MRLGIFGGTFNPIHEGHVNLAEYFMDVLSLDEVVFIPTGIPPHKESPDLEKAWDRFYMTKLAIHGKENMYALDTEIKREGKSRTYDTLEWIKEEYPGDEYYLLMGGDMFLSFEEWYNFEEIFDTATLCTVPRNEGQREELLEYGKHLDEMGADVFIGNIEPIEVSSTEIRAQIRNNESNIENMSQKVLDYIETIGLYNRQIDESLLKCYELAKEMLLEPRFTHSVNVAKMAIYLAIIHGEDTIKAGKAGLLHDLFKSMKPEEMLQKVDNADIILGNLKDEAKAVWHGPLAAAYLKQEGIIEDEDILNAIKYHTLARGGMSRLEQTVYVADVTSIERDFDGIDELRETAEKSLTEAMNDCTAYSICNLVERRLPVLEGAIEAYNETTRKLKERN